MFSWVRRQIRGRKQNDRTPIITTPKHGSGIRKARSHVTASKRTTRAIARRKNRNARRARAKNRTR